MIETPFKNRYTEAPTSRVSWDSLRSVGCGGDPEDVAAAIAWLLDPVNFRASGQVVSIDGGLALLRGGARASGRGLHEASRSRSQVTAYQAYVERFTFRNQALG